MQPSAVWKQTVKWVGRAIALVGFFRAADLSLAQGCSMCATTAAANNAAVHALRSGILILLIPPVLITLGIFAMALRRQDRFADDDSSDASVDRELNEWLARTRPVSMQVSDGATPLPRAKSSVLPKASS